MPLHRSRYAVNCVILAAISSGVWTGPSRADEASYWTDHDEDVVLRFVQDPGAEAAEAPAPPVTEPQPAPRTRFVRLQRNTVRSRFRLASVPNMFGDTFPSAGQVFAGLAPTAGADIGLAGGARRMKIAENNKALPMDRMIFMYNRFYTALAGDDDVATPGGVQRFAVDRYTLGLEKTFADGLWSIDVRMPFTSDYAFTSPSLAVSGGNIGNLNVSLKRLLYETDDAAIVAGLGIDLPTGSDVRGSAIGFPMVVHNDAVLLMPYLGLLVSPDDLTFGHAFVQLDVPANGNRIDVPPLVSGVYNDQSLLYLDASVGRWLYRDAEADYLRGLAALLELHYTTTLQDTDVVGGALPRPIFGESANRRDILNFTLGLHAEVAQTDFRVGAVFPLREKPNRVFSSELQVQINRHF